MKEKEMINLEKVISIDGENKTIKEITIKNGLKMYQYSINTDVESWQLKPAREDETVVSLVERMLETLIDLRSLISLSTEMMVSIMIKLTLSQKFWEEPIMRDNQVSVLEEQKIEEQLLTVKRLMKIRKQDINDLEESLIEGNVITKK